MNGNCLGRLRKLWLVSVDSVSRGGDPWTFRSSCETEGTAATVVLALRRIWELIADDRLVVYIAFGSLMVAAVSVMRHTEVYDQIGLLHYMAISLLLLNSCGIQDCAMFCLAEEAAFL